MKNLILTLVGVPALLLMNSCSNKPKAPVEEEKKQAITDVIELYSGDSINMNGFLSYDASNEVKRPIVMVVHEWWGQNEYVKKRARQLAALGYLAFAVDMYGEGRIAENPDDAGKLAMPFYTDPAKAQRRFDAALAKAKSHPMADTNQIVAIGYCFGGSMVLNMARLGENLDGVVSFHGNLQGIPPSKEKLKAPVLICHGEADKFVSADEVKTFKKQMDSIGAVYTFKGYPNATHAFSNPDATENGKKFNLPIAYNAAADSASWNDMKTFFGTIFKK